MAKKRVAIIGGAASGLPAIRHALLYDIEPVCFELTDDIGGLWRYKADNRNYKGIDVSSVMKSTVINTSKEMTAYSDFPPKAETANYMHNSEMLQYLRDYAAHHGLKKYIKFSHKVLSVDRAEDYSETGRWKLTYLDEKDIEHVETFDGVLLACGHHSEPRWPPPFPGQDGFKGQLLHSHDYHSHKGLEDQVVAVVGIGNSGGDIAVELARVAKQVYLVTRRGTWVCKRLQEGGYPRDASMTRKDMFLRGWASYDKINDILEAKLNQSLNHEAYGLKPKHRFLSAHPTCNDELANCLANKTIRIKPNIKEFTEHGLIFEDGTSVPHVDTVIFATGYKFQFSLVEKGDLIPVTDNVVSLYLNMFAPALSDHNSLAVLGLVQPWGSIMPISEMQSRVFYDVLVGSTKLPSQAEMLKFIAQKRMELQRRYVQSPRHTIQVDGSHIEELATIIGCQPRLLRLFVSDPALAWTVWNSPFLSYAYRLGGPHPWTGARKAVMEARDRIFAGMSPNGKILVQSQEKGISLVKVASVGLVLAITYGFYSKKITYNDIITQVYHSIGYKQ